MSTCLSICIPRIESFVTKRYIWLSFKNIGDILKIDLVSCGNGNKKAFVHFICFYNNENSINFKKIIEEGEIVKFVHSEFGWFWKCSKSRSKQILH